MFKPIVSIIVRTKNESHWIGKCLHVLIIKIIEEYIADMVEYNEGNSKLIKLEQNYNLPLKNGLFS